MHVLLVAHGFPPELEGGTERSVAALARDLARAGERVTVLAGTLARASGAQVEVRASTLEVDEPATPGTARTTVRVLRVARPDLYFDHWHKELAPQVAGVLRDVIADGGVDVVHVHHWLRLSRDLVATAARAGVPALVTLHDAWTSCPLAFRVRPDTRARCATPAGAHPCVACAGKVPPRTPWIGMEQGWMAFARRQDGLARELDLARTRCVPTRAHGLALERFLARAPGSLDFEVLPPHAAFEMPAPRAPAAGDVAGADAPGLVLVHWGALSAHKGVDELVDALALAGARADVELHLLGHVADGAYAQELRRRAGSARLHFDGPYDASELARHPVVRRAHAFAHAARALESYSLVLEEARALGLPCIAFDDDLARERLLGEPGAAPSARLVARGEGVDAGNGGGAHALADAWVALARDRARRDDLGRAAAALALDLARARPRARLAALERTRALYARALSLGPAECSAPAWFEPRLEQEFLLQWDARLAQCSPEALGFGATGARPEALPDARHGSGGPPEAEVRGPP